MSYSLALPSNAILNDIQGTFTQVTRRVEIYQSDNTTLWESSPSQLGLIGGSVSVDATRDERRQFGLTLDNSDYSLQISPSGLWYDKIVKIYRGIKTSAGGSYEAKLGEFLIDSLKYGSSPHQVQLSGRDFTKKLILDKFTEPTTFTMNTPVENVISAIATNGGCTKQIIAVTGNSLPMDYTFAPGSSRWEAIKKLSTDAACDTYFDANGYLHVDTFTDPYLDAPQFTFQTGVNSNISKFDKSVDDTLIKNRIVVVANSTDGSSLPYYAIATNTTPTSPTRIALIGTRTDTIDNVTVGSQQDAQDIADKFLKVSALEPFVVDLSALVIPFLEAGITVGFIDPHPASGDPTKYLLSNFTIPLELTTMSANLRRVTQVG